ncbi:MAG TPA: hypothetical protein VIT67_19505 [Povalibacter sp.]
MKDELRKLGLRIRPRKVAAVTNETAAKAGKVGFDDRGNAQFEWSNDRLNEDGDLGERLRKKALSHPGLSLVDDEPPPNAPVRPNPKGLKLGYNPYESGMLTKKAKKPKRDLRELSKWIEAKKKAGEGNPEDQQ